MSQHGSELCAFLVGDIYGDLTSLIFDILLRHGRLSLPALRRHTCLASRLLKHGLSVLIQQQLVLWYTTNKNVTTYEAKPEAAYTLLRSGKYVKIVEDRMGKLAGQAVFHLLTLGHARVGDFVQGYKVANERGIASRPISTNGSDKPQRNGLDLAIKTELGEGTTLNLVHATLCELLQLGFISKVNMSHFRSDADNRIEAENVVPPVEYYKAKTKKENEAQWEASVTRKLTDWKYGTDEGTLEFNGIQKGNKRLQEDTMTSKPGKRQRLDLQPYQRNNAMTEQSRAGESGFLHDSTVVQINHVKFAAIMRNEFLIRIAAQSICIGTSKVYAEVLRALEPNLLMCRSEDDTWTDHEGDRDLSALPQISTEQLGLVIKDTTELVSALGNVQDSMVGFSKFEHPKKRRKKEFSDEDEAKVVGDASSDEDEGGTDSDQNDSAVDSDSDQANGDADYKSSSISTISKDPHCEAIRDHLLLLAQHPHKFLHHFPQTSILPERWTVDFISLMRNITHHTMMQTITRRHGILARRITQILHETGKVGEKDLTNLTLVDQKVMRSRVAALCTAGMIHVQEIPRDPSRNPARSMFLWFFDIERARAKLQDETYQAMARCLQRLRLEREKVRHTVEKASRSDVVGKEAQFLSAQELEALKKWRALEARVWGQVGRMDDVVAIMRDY